MSKSRGHRCYGFTLNNHTEQEVAQLHAIYLNLCKDFAAQEEIGELGTPHIQGYVCFKDCKTLSAVIKLLPRRCAKIQGLRKAIAMKTYCLKNDTHVGRRWTPKGIIDKWVKPNGIDICPIKSIPCPGCILWGEDLCWYYRTFGFEN